MRVSMGLNNPTGLNNDEIKTTTELFDSDDRHFFRV